ncbi:MAG: hypothetical protein GYA16_15015, partial [Spirochaetes bacterium]|nr:hypothetical protein [Spirochaetota bacterium]
MKVRLLIIILLIIAFSSTVFGADKYALIELNGSVNPVIADYIVNSIK